jgi:pimeloyl-ACP methyl ester carboxylesterase
MALANPVIVLPGITASSLRDEYPVSPESVWTAILKKSYQRIALHPDDTRYELVEPSRVVPDALFGIPYEELVLELRHNLRDHEDEPVPVFPFPYDWRQPLARTCEQLAAFVEEVIARTRLLRHYAKSAWVQDARVDLVGHSMGGLVIAGYLAGADSRGGPPRVGKVATLGTPFRGSYEAVLKVITGTASLSPLEPSSREREAARLTPALYHLVPSFENAVVDEAGAAVDLFDPKSWQGGVIATLAEHIRLHGVDPPRSAAERRVRGRELLAGMLAGARAFLDRVEALSPARAGLAPGAWLAIAGVDAETRVRLRVVGADSGVRFHLTSKDRANTWDGDTPSLDTGDGTVPLAGARPTFLPDEELVCVKPGDLGYWELADRVLLSPVGWHGLMPKCNLVQRLVVKHFRGLPGDDSVWASPMPGILPDAWRPPIKKLRAK